MTSDEELQNYYLYFIERSKDIMWCFGSAHQMASMGLCKPPNESQSFDSEAAFMWLKIHTSGYRPDDDAICSYVRHKYPESEYVRMVGLLSDFRYEAGREYME